MTKPRKQKDYTPKPSKTGMMTCDLEHQWIAINQNPERVLVPCPVCGSQTSVNRLEKL